MSFKFSSLVLIIFTVGFISIAYAEEKNIPVFTNQDIDKYKVKSEGKVQDVKIGKVSPNSGNKERAQKIIEAKEQEYWCKRATVQKRKIEHIQEDISDSEKNLSGEVGGRVTHKKKKEFTKRIEVSRKKLKYAERDLADIEDEAHRKGVPPGWLRCQFE